MDPASHLARQGRRSSTLKQGDKITVEVYPLRNDEKGGQYISVTLPDGKKRRAARWRDLSRGRNRSRTPP